MSVMGGWTSTEQQREIANNLAPGGVETASAEYDGYFIAPELFASMEAGNGFAVSGKLRYTGYFLDGFSEQGSSGAVTVDSRDMHLLNGRLQLDTRHESTLSDGSENVINFYVGVEGQSNLGSDDDQRCVAGAANCVRPECGRRRVFGICRTEQLHKDV